MRKKRVTKKLLREITRRIVDRFDPHKIILFGSHARGNADPESDIDILVIMPVEGSKREKAVEIGMALNEFSIAKDIFVNTPDQFAWRRKTTGTLEHPADREGIILYERS